MGLIVKGKWVDKWYDTKSSGGRFVRQESTFRSKIGSTLYPAEPNRYHLFISYACPWAHRTHIFCHLKDLLDIVTISVVDPIMLENGWELQEPKGPVDHVEYLYQVYLKANPNYEGRVTVPVLWDKISQTIVNNESSEIIRMLNTEFNHITNNFVDFYPFELKSDIDKMNQFVYDSINNGVYKVGFATDQHIYNSELTKLFAALDTLDEHLGRHRFLVGDRLTEADWRLFVTLVRFDPVYVGHFKCNLKRIFDYPNLIDYVRYLYQYKTISETVYMDHIKTHYYASHPSLNPTGIVPGGPNIDYTAPYNR
ncbi:glutathione-dependent reductase [Candidatus Marinamargulisbacteria bacterium SCGC AG-410-N11]|nr:glutathione-dependent reductase [Candidatus Marinamargulisbacteria bacterium SCGC AG-410-N11]